MNYKELTDHPHGVKFLYDKCLHYAKTLPPDRIFVDVGAFKGGSAIMMMNAIKESGIDRWVWSVDPYGSKPFRYGTTTDPIGYVDKVYVMAMVEMSKTAQKLKAKHYLWRMTSEDFMEHGSKVKFYDNGKVLDMHFGFVYLDGEHYNELVKKEFDWFRERTKGMIVIDDDPYSEIGIDAPVDNFRRYVEV